jgi:hypothetical protein
MHVICTGKSKTLNSAEYSELNSLIVLSRNRAVVVRSESPPPPDGHKLLMKHLFVAIQRYIVLQKTDILNGPTFKHILFVDTRF